VAAPGEQFANEKDARRAPQNKVTPGFFETLRIPLLRGRSFTDRDLQEGRRAVIVNESLAEQLWPKQEAVGRTVIVENQPCEVVGVARYNNFRRSGEPAEAFIFRAEFGGNRLLVRLRSDPRAALPLLRREILSVDPNVAISETLSVSEMMQNFFAKVRMAMIMLSYAGALALLLSAVGLYGVLAMAVSGRTREIGVRRALGAPDAAVASLILRQGLSLTLCGVILGLVSAAALTRFLSDYLYGVTPHDPGAFVAVASLLAAIALLACWLPARRAMKVDPLVALRHE
jgi:hypothetical protein